MDAPMRIVLVEDGGWRGLRPLTWLRPAGDLLVGGRTNAERWEEPDSRPVSVLCRPEIASLDPKRRCAGIPAEPRTRLWVRDRWIPDRAMIDDAVSEGAPKAWLKDGVVVAARCEVSPPAGETPGNDPFWAALAEGCPRVEPAGGAWIGGLADLVAESAARIEGDLERDLARMAPPQDFGDGAAYAPGRIRLGKGCQVDHFALLDAREGAIVLGPGTRVFPHTWIRGPFGCRENCLLLGGRIGGGSYFGPGCRVRGEVEASIFHGFDNKAHDGFVGHSYLGEWVNLGAMTTTSDLKNNYAPVRLQAYGEQVGTGQRKIGSFIGDHVKTRIGSLLCTGSVIGLASNLFGETTLFPKWVPDFLWGVGADAEEYDLERCLRTAATVLERRGHVLSDDLRRAFEIAFLATGADRDGARA